MLSALDDILSKAFMNAMAKPSHDLDTDQAQKERLLNNNEDEEQKI
jgi:hypothetical protein